MFSEHEPIKRTEYMGLNTQQWYVLKWTTSRKSPAQPDTYVSVESVKPACTSAPCTQQLHFLSCANELDRSATTQKQLFDRGLCARGVGTEPSEFCFTTIRQNHEQWVRKTEKNTKSTRDVVKQQVGTAWDKHTTLPATSHTFFRTARSLHKKDKMWFFFFFFFRPWRCWHPPRASRHWRVTQGSLDTKPGGFDRTAWPLWMFQAAFTTSRSA